MSDLGRLLITSAGGPATSNVIMNLNLIPKSPVIIGLDIDKYMLKLSKADYNELVHSAKDENKYVINLIALSDEFKVNMLYPQSDIEVFVVSKNRHQLPPVALPSPYVIQLCQGKADLYNFLANEKLRVPPYKNLTKDNERELSYESPNFGAFPPSQWKYPCWVRATHGAGGNKGFICRDWRDLRNMVEFYREREDVRWQMVKLLSGRDYSWTSLWYNGKLITSVLKERLKWVYNRIGTTAVQRTVHNDDVNKYCHDVVNAIADEYDRNLTGIMMIDLKEDTDDNKFYITEINAGRLGTVNYNYGLWSRQIYNDDRLNFPWLLWNIGAKDKLPNYDYKMYDALPQGLYYARMIDMGYRTWSE